MQRNDICHICLEDTVFISSSLIKNCCNGFICNACWIDILENMNINNCPICDIPLVTNQEREITLNNNYLQLKRIIKKLIMIIKWICCGYILTIISVLIIYHEEFNESMRFLHTNLYFWPLCLAYGFLITTFIEWGCNTQCQSWYP